jgi:hypothetical protein
MMAWLFYCHSCCFRHCFWAHHYWPQKKGSKRKKGREREKEDGAFIDDKAKALLVFIVIFGSKL